MIIKLLKDLLYRNGFKINKISKLPILHENYLIAIKNHLAPKAVLFDVGANHGQTVGKFKKHFQHAQIHSFEPSKKCFEILCDNYGSADDVVLNNKAVGASKSKLEFNEYSWSSLNSILKRSFTSSKIIDTYLVNVITIDDYCEEYLIKNINLLKTDTEGYDLNVLKGADVMFTENRIQFVFIEIFFYENFVGQSSFGDIYNYLISKGFNLVRFYTFEFTDKGYLSRTDALFFNENFVATDK